MNREKQRQAAQLAFVASGQEIEVGKRGDLPLSIEALAGVRVGEPWVVEALPW